ncbi:MAG: DUF839 domain-containing protein [Burkholderiales bacterium]|nr:MAG: DUF839 domain-containing protein [Burkholderiales bacterium]
MKPRILVALIASAAASGALAQITGPSSSASPYVTPTAPGWSVTSLITVGDSVNFKPDGVTPYRMVGIPDGLGAYDNGNGTFTVLMNHELGSTSGIARAHGSAGAFVSEWVINSSTLKVQSGADLVTQHLVWNNQSNSYMSAIGQKWDAASNRYVASANSEANSFARLCSADLPAVSAFYNASTGLGTQNRIYMAGEETGAEGRAYAFIASGSDKGKAYELNRLGKFSWENSVANPWSGNKTVVIGTDDSTPGQVYVYTGTKTNTGSDIERAGLTNGSLRGIKVDAANAQGNGAGSTSNNVEVGPINGSFSTVAVDTSVSGATLQSNSRAAKITEFARPEDGHWANANTFYFVTTGTTTTGVQSSKLYKLSFALQAGGAVDYDNGTISMELDSATLTGKDGQQARTFDNIVVADDGTLLIQEDPGNTNYIAKTWHYDPATKTSTQVLESDRARFQTGGSSFLTVDEESSGIIEVTSILGRNDGKRYFLADMQAHNGITGELVEGGQLYLVSYDAAAAVPEPSTYALMFGGLGLMGWLARRRKAA